MPKIFFKLFEDKKGNENIFTENIDNRYNDDTMKILDESNNEINVSGSYEKDTLFLNSEILHTIDNHIDDDNNIISYNNKIMNSIEDNNGSCNYNSSDTEDFNDSEYTSNTLAQNTPKIKVKQ